MSAAEARQPAAEAKPKRAKKPAPTRLQLDLESVLPAVSTDKARPHLMTPFGRLMNGRGYIVGTDGHRLHAVRSDEWASHARPDAPRAEHVIPWHSARLGEFSAALLDDARPLCWSSRCQSVLEVGSKGERVFFHAPAQSKNKPALYPFGRDGVPVSWLVKLDALKYDFAVELPYLLDAVDFVGPGFLTIWGAGKLEPLIITPGTRPAELADRFAVVMPYRV